MKLRIESSTVRYLLLGSALAGVLQGATPKVEAAARVRLNGALLPTQVPPLQRNGRTLVPMRTIFQALGAQVRWNGLTKEITAQSGSSNVRMQIGNRQALVNNQRVTLDQAPLLYRSYTMVPLRFVAEGLGADVHWNQALQLVSINTTGTAGQPGDLSNVAGAGRNNTIIPANVVIPVRMNSIISSADARVGDVFTARVRSQATGDSEFPAATLLEGVVTAVQRRRANNPGLLDVNFRAAILPGGTRVPLRGELIGLDDDSVLMNSEGRMVARAPQVNGRNFQIVGVGQGGVGFAVGEVVQNKNAITQVRSPRGTTLYRRNVNRNLVGEAVVPRGQEFGVRIVNTVSYNDATGYRQDRQQYLQNR
jgi:hypothetical protein